MTITYRLTKGSALTATEFDNNFHDLDDRMVTQEALTVGVGISSITVSGNQMTVHMTDSSLQGPFTLPTLDWSTLWKGVWLPSTVYAAGDIISAQGSLYVVLLAHTSDSTFDPGATETVGNLYGLLLAIPDIPSVTVSGATFTPGLAYARTYIRCTNATGCVVTIEDDGVVNFPIDTELHFRDVNTTPGDYVAFEAATGVTINVPSGYLAHTAVTGATVTLKKVAANEWDLLGLLAVDVSA